jgi:ribosome-binding ATPase YchF (GTP1/OBG family)
MQSHKNAYTEASLTDTFQAQFRGYGANVTVINRFLDTLTNTRTLESWTDEDIADCVDKFLKQRFPTVIALNKIDLPDSDKNISSLSEKYNLDLVLVSALSEVFLKKLQAQGFIRYLEGTDTIDLAEDLPEDSPIKLKPLDDKTKGRLEKVQDLVLFRYGSTGVQECVKRAVESLGLIPMFPVKSIHNYTSSALGKSGGVFRDCFLIKPGTTVKQFAAMVHPDLEKHYHSAETVGGRQLAEDDVLTKEINIIAYKKNQEG